ncbi:MAG TPA: hypothetical protein DHU96_03460 [Actinobacteria bacterium]|nr:hypothetical protein [Actinomycetota bacterium]
MVCGRVSRPAARRIKMQPFISQALVATRIAEMRREAEVAQLARDGRLARKQARRRGGRGLAPVRLLRTAKPACRPERTGLPAA